MDVIKAPRLRKGELIALVSPAGTPHPREKIEKSVRYLESLGYRVVVGAHASAEYGYLAGTDQQRAGDLNLMIRDPTVKAIFALRGGYGTPRILRFIDYTALRRSPKIITGFSDITGLQLAVFRKCALITFSGPVPAVEFWNDPDPYTEEQFWRLLTSTRKGALLENPPEAELGILQNGQATGILLGGNLALVVASLGTPFFPSMSGAVLVLEEVGEYPYRVDRMLTQLVNSGVTRKVNALVLGHFTKCEPRDSSRPSFTVDEVIHNFVNDAQVDGPIVSNLQYGHIARKLTVPVGARARVDARKKQIEILESAVV